MRHSWKLVDRKTKNAHVICRKCGKKGRVAPLRAAGSSDGCTSRSAG